VLLLEIGEAQKDKIIELGLEYGLDVSVLSDYSGFPRIATCKRMEA
jgi:methylase of polypeptide subunit release factors